MAPTRQGGKGKRGRPKKAGEQTAAQKRTEPSKQAGSKGKPGRKSSSRVEKHNATLNTKSSRAVAPRRQLQEADIEAQDEIAPDATATTAAKRTVKRPEYVSLEAKTRRIPQNVISKWPVISASVVDQITVLLKHAKDAVALSRRDPQKQMEADELLHGVIQQLGRHLSGMKIPPRAKAQHFDIDQLTTRNEGLLYALTTERDKNKLLKDKITETETRLEREEETLKEARANAQQWHREWRNREKKQLHPLLQQSEDATTALDRPEDLNLTQWAPTDTSGLDAPDSELAPLLERLRRNLETMQGNHAQVDGIGEAVRHAQTALDALIFKHAGAQQRNAL